MLDMYTAQNVMSMRNKITAIKQSLCSRTEIKHLGDTPRIIAALTSGTKVIHK